MLIWIRTVALLGTTVLSLAIVTTAASAQTADYGASVSLDPDIACWYHDGFPELIAHLEPSSDVEHARLYFRCSSYPEYYFVNLDRAATGSYRGVGPMAESSCPAVHYYVEAVNRNFTTSRTPEKVADVTTLAACRRRYPAAAAFAGRPRLVIGSTLAGAPRMAPGFQTLGIEGYLTPTGQLVSGGALSSTAFVAIGAGVAAGGVAAVTLSGTSDEPTPGETPTGPAAAGDEPESESTVGTPPPPPPPEMPPPPASEVRACIEIDPPNATITAGDSIRLDARCSTGGPLSFRWDLGDGRPPREGPFITPVYRNPGRFTVTLTVESAEGFGEAAQVRDTASREIEVLEPPEMLVACFNGFSVNLGNNCDVVFDGSCSVGDIVAYDWILDETNVMGAGPYPEAGLIVSHDWTGFPGCQTAAPWPKIQVKLTVTGRSGQQATTTGLVDVQWFQAPARPGIDDGASGMLGSHLEIAPGDGSVTGRIALDERASFVIGNDAPRAIPLGGATNGGGTHTIEATLQSRISHGGLWHFDLSRIPGFRAGSLRVVSGDVALASASTVAFRLHPGGNGVLRFTFATGAGGGENR